MSLKYINKKAAIVYIYTFNNNLNSIEKHRS